MTRIREWFSWWGELTKQEKINLVSKAIIFKLMLTMWFYNKLIATILTISVVIDVIIAIKTYKRMKRMKDGRTK